MVWMCLHMEFCRDVFIPRIVTFLLTGTGMTINFVGVSCAASYVSTLNAFIQPSPTSNKIQCNYIKTKSLGCNRVLKKYFQKSNLVVHFTSQVRLLETHSLQQDATENNYFGVKTFWVFFRNLDLKSRKIGLVEK